MKGTHNFLSIISNNLYFCLIVYHQHDYRPEKNSWSRIGLSPIFHIPMRILKADILKGIEIYLNPTTSISAERSHLTESEWVSNYGLPEGTPHNLLFLRLSATFPRYLLEKTTAYRRKWMRNLHRRYRCHRHLTNFVVDNILICVLRALIEITF